MIEDKSVIIHYFFLWYNVLSGIMSAVLLNARASHSSNKAQYLTPHTKHEHFKFVNLKRCDHINRIAHTIHRVFTFLSGGREGGEGREVGD